MRLFVAITDSDWFGYPRRHSNNHAWSVASSPDALRGALATDYNTN